VTATPVAAAASTATIAGVAEGKAVLDVSDQSGGDSSSEQQPQQKTEDDTANETASVTTDTPVEPSETGKFVSSHRFCSVLALCLVPLMLAINLRNCVMRLRG
jgi:hypothetical protein